MNLRRAAIDDVDRLSRICRRAFPTSVRWASKRTASRWWRVALSHPAAETWVAEDSQVLGFVLIILDEKEWARMSGDRRPRVADVVTSLPATAAALVRGIVHAGLGGSDRPVDLCENSGALTDRPRVWLELIAVDPSARARGIGRLLLERVDRRAIELRRGSVRLMVKASNARARRSYEAIGYRPTRIAARQIVYTKTLDAEGVAT